MPSSGVHTVDMAFYIQSVHSGKYLDVKGASKDSGAEVIIYSFTGNKNQQWQYKNGMIYSKHNGLVMDIEGGGSDGKIIMYKGSKADNQKWVFDDDFTIRSGKGTVLDVKEGGTNDATQVVAYAKHGGQHQKFRVVPVDDK